MDIHALIKTGAFFAVQDLLNRQANAVNSRDWSDKTPLHIAVVCCQTDMVTLLVACGADVTATAVGHGTPLHSACAHNKQEVASLLVSLGASITEKDERGETPLDRIHYHDWSGKFAKELEILAKNLEDELSTPQERASNLLENIFERHNQKQHKAIECAAKESDEAKALGLDVASFALYQQLQGRVLVHVEAGARAARRLRLRTLTRHIAALKTAAATAPLRDRASFMTLLKQKIEDKKMLEEGAWEVSVVTRASASAAAAALTSTSANHSLDISRSAEGIASLRVDVDRLFVRAQERVGAAIAEEDFEGAGKVVSLCEQFFSLEVAELHHAGDEEGEEERIKIEGDASSSPLLLSRVEVLVSGQRATEVVVSMVTTVGVRAEALLRDPTADNLVALSRLLDGLWTVFDGLLTPEQGAPLPCALCAVGGLTAVVRSVFGVAVQAEYFDVSDKATAVEERLAAVGLRLQAQAEVLTAAGVDIGIVDGVCVGDEAEALKRQQETNSQNSAGHKQGLAYGRMRAASALLLGEDHQVSGPAAALAVGVAVVVGAAAYYSHVHHFWKRFHYTTD